MAKRYLAVGSKIASRFLSMGPFINYVGKMRGGGGCQKMSVFVHAKGIKNVHAGGGLKNGKIVST